MASSFFATILGYIDAGASTFFVEVSTRLSAALGPTVITVLAIGIALWAFGMYFQWVKEPIMDGLLRILRVTAIIALALSGIYQTWIAAPIYALPDQLAQAVTGGTSQSVNILIDDTLARGMLVASLIKDTSAGMSLTDALGIYLTALAVLLFVLAICGISAAIIGLSKLALVILLGFGPLFIALMLVPAAKHLVNGWAQQALNFVLLYPFVAAVITLTFAVWKIPLMAAVNLVVDPWAGFAMVVGSGFMVIYILLQIQMIVRGVVTSWHLDPLPLIKGAVAGALGAFAASRYIATRGAMVAGVAAMRFRR